MEQPYNFTCAHGEDGQPKLSTYVLAEVSACPSSRGWSGARVGVGRLMGFLVSWFFGFVGSWFLLFFGFWLVSKFLPKVHVMFLIDIDLMSKLFKNF